MDGQMSEDIRIGILVRTEMQRAGMWRRKDGLLACYFDSALLEEAGGIMKLIQEWKPEPAR